MNLYREAIVKFQDILEAAKQIDNSEPTAMTLATVNENGQPRARTVLLKKADERGFMFVTNSTSRKGRNITANPHAALCFYWHMLHRQVRVEGTVELASTEEVDAYWITRPRGSQIGAWASQQSQPLDSADTLLKRQKKYELQYANETVPRPPHWLAYRIRPNLIEFWKSGDYRLHQRVCYLESSGEWSRTMLYP